MTEEPRVCPLKVPDVVDTTNEFASTPPEIKRSSLAKKKPSERCRDMTVLGELVSGRWNDLSYC